MGCFENTSEKHSKVLYFTCMYKLPPKQLKCDTRQKRYEIEGMDDTR